MKTKTHKLSKITSTLLCTGVLILSACSESDKQSASANKLTEQSAKASSKDPFAQEIVLQKLVDFNDAKVSQIMTLEDTELSRSQNDPDKINLLFSEQASIPTARIEPREAWNLSQFTNYNLAFDVVNDNPDSVQLYLSVENPDGKYQKRSISLAKGFDGTVYFPLDGKEAITDTGFWGDAPPWQTEDQLMIWRSWRSEQVDTSKIAALTFHVIGPMSNKSIKLGDIRIRKNPPSDPQWMRGVVDKFGQNAKREYPLKVSSTEELQQLAQDELSTLEQSSGMPHRSKYGGYTNAPRQKATGYFRTQKIDGKWWLIDPEGYIFFSHGPANVRMANMTTLTGIDFKDDAVRYRDPAEVTPEDSMGIVKVSKSVRESKYVQSPLRYNMFKWLPEYDDDLAEHYSYRRSTHKGPVPHGETYSFYRANLERKYGETSPESYIKKWQEVTLDRMNDWGFTSFGNWVDPALYEYEQVPYFANGWIIGDFQTLSGYKNHWGLMPDPFDPLFKQRAEHTIKVVAEEVNSSPWCVGIFIDNEKSWGEREGSVEERYGVILDALSKPAQQSFAKTAFVEYLQNTYSSLEQLNTAWEAQFSSWQTVQAGITFSNYSEGLVKDLSTLLELLGEQYFKVVHNTLSSYLPNHLYMGARMANWGMPDEIIKASLKYSDVLSFNIYEEGVQDHAWKFLEEVDLPTVVGEFHFGTATDSGMFNPGIVHASDQQDRARMYKAYMESVLNKPYMVGAHWFQYIDEPISGRAFDGENANIGFVTITDIPYPQMIEAVKEVTSSMYQKRLKKDD